MPPWSPPRYHRRCVLLFPGLSTGQRSHTCLVPQKGLSVLSLEGLALEFFPAIPIRSCGTRGSLNQEVEEAKLKTGDRHAVAPIRVLFFLLSLTFQSSEGRFV